MLKFRQYSNDDLDQHLKNLEIFGYTVVKNYIDKKTVANLKAKTEDYFKIYKKKIINEDVKNLSEDRCIHNLQNLDVNYIELLSSPFIEKAIFESCKIKMSFVNEDEFENLFLTAKTEAKQILCSNFSSPPWVWACAISEWRACDGSPMDDEPSISIHK